MIVLTHGERQDLAAKSPVVGSLPARYQHALQCDDAEERCRFLKEPMQQAGLSAGGSFPTPSC
jgi:hypothetical protein